MSITEAINKAIQDNLPASVAGELRNYLNEAENTKLALKKSEDSLINSLKELNELKKELSVATEKEKKHNDLLSRETALRENENNLKVQMAELKVNEAEKRAAGIHQLAETVFRNRSMTRDTSYSVPFQQPGTGYIQRESVHRQERITEIED